MLWNYVKIAFRNLNRCKAFSLINLAGLAIGIAAFLVIMHYVEFELSYDRFHENADRIYRIRNDRIYKDISDNSAGCPPGLGPALKQEFPEIAEVARIYNISWMNNIVSYAPDFNRDNSSNSRSQREVIVFSEENVFYADNTFLRIFSFPLISGQSTTALSEPNTAVITETLATKYFGDRDPLNATLEIKNNYGSQAYKITGVLKDIPANSHVKFTILLSLSTPTRAGNINDIWGWNAFNTYILLDPNTLAADLESKFMSIVEKYNLSSEDFKRVLSLQRLLDIHLHSNLRLEPETNGNALTVYFLSIIAVFILLIAWINYINLATARSVLRAREIGVRKVLGSHRSELIRQFVLETFLLNLISLCIAVVLAEVLMPYFIQITGKSLPLTFSYRIWSVLCISVISGSILSGIYPAFVISSFRPISVLKGSFSRQAKGLLLRKGLVIFQFVISLVLIISTIVVYDQLSFMRNKDLGLTIDKILILKTPTGEKYPAMQKFKGELLRFPFIIKVAASSTIPGKEYSNASSGIRPQNSAPENGKRCFFVNVDEEYFDLFKIELLAGNSFTANSKYNKAVILNEEAVKILGFGKPEDAVNQKIVLGGMEDQAIEVVGVVKDYHHKSLNNPIEPVIFNPLDNVRYFSIKYGAANPDQLIALVSEKWNEIFPNQPFEYYFIDDIFDAQYNSDRRFGNIFMLFTFLTIFISCLGLFGLLSFSFAQRTKEVGIRKVLGASIESVVSLLAGELLHLMAVANLIAWPLAYYAMIQWLQNFAYSTDLTIFPFVLGGLIALGIALTTVLYQTIKTARANPVEALRHE